MTAYYNEIDPFAAEWLRELIKVGAIAPGTVDERSIEDVRPSDLRGFTQCHFFAGIGVWSYALRQSGWPDDRPVWTGSCPCQPFSAAGKGAGFSDERHLWPAFFHLIEQCRPAIVFGEQVASKAIEPWIDLVQDDLEAVGYAFGCVPFPSASVGAPHIRDRAYWVADADNRGKLPLLRAEQNDSTQALRRSEADKLGRCLAGGDKSELIGMANAGVPQREPQQDFGASSIFRAATQQEERRDVPSNMGAALNSTSEPGPTNGFWRDVDWLFCRDGKWRPVEPGSFPLVNGATERVGRLRGYGNAINAEAAKAFIAAFMEAA